MSRSQLSKQVALKFTHLPLKDVEAAVKTILEHMAETLANGDRIEIRGFGSFSLRLRPARVGRNPRTGELVSLPDRYTPHFKAGKGLRAMVDVKAGE
ncbi:MAG: integration host factor subunit beta [Gammaproteobacteria bacterium]|nr:integration host factor subunit beta [Gammaproteobacteria bacterium]